MQDYQKKFINFLIKSGALTFGDFITKSGRKTPYFINTGNFNDGQKIYQLGEFYAEHILASGLNALSLIFGPAYKGIPLAVTSASALFHKHNLNVGFAFDRKEIKDHGDRGRLVGKKISDGEKIVLVEDVITAGTTMREALPMLKALGDVSILGVVIAVDRAERGNSELSAKQEVEKNLGVRVYPIVDIHQILDYLSGPDNSSGFKLDAELIEKAKNYLTTYGARG